LILGHVYIAVIVLAFNGIKYELKRSAAIGPEAIVITVTEIKTVSSFQDNIIHRIHVGDILVKRHGRWIYGLYVAGIGYEITLFAVKRNFSHE
jgi:hypothetical protein